ncbi:hypothetical protein B6U99_05855 [Candidatus Geothermarchaeota archaeon ex4572_27]|nr:MAG: hypothetical protein B6U99_05855 [Candidatus Geothermarchaeota archaeon ex4572_27]
MLLLALLACLTACASSIIGVGGGFLYVPLLNLAASQPIEVSVGTSKLAVTLTAYIAAATYLRRGALRLKRALRPSAFTTAGSLAGVAFLHRVGGPPVKMMFVAASIAAYANMLRRPRGGEVRGYVAPPLFTLAGFLAGCTGLGGGFLYTPLLCSLAGMSVHEAAATSLAIIAVTSTAASIGHLGLGHVDLNYAAALLVGVCVGASIGPRASSRAGEGALRAALGVALLAASASMAYSVAVGAP